MAKSYYELIMKSRARRAIKDSEKRVRISSNMSDNGEATEYRLEFNVDGIYETLFASNVKGILEYLSTMYGMDMENYEKKGRQGFIQVYSDTARFFRAIRYLLDYREIPGVYVEICPDEEKSETVDTCYDFRKKTGMNTVEYQEECLEQLMEDVKMNLLKYNLERDVEVIKEITDSDEYNKLIDLFDKVYNREISVEEFREEKAKI